MQYLSDKIMRKKKKTVENPPVDYNLAMPVRDKENYKLRLYITGSTSRSALALTNLKKICEEYLEGHYELEVIDLYKNPGLAKGDQIIAAPTLIKKLPLPFRRIIGDMTNKDKVLLGLDLKEVKV